MRWGFRRRHSARFNIPETEMRESNGLATSNVSNEIDYSKAHLTFAGSVYTLYRRIIVHGSFVERVESFKIPSPVRNNYSFVDRILSSRGRRKRLENFSPVQFDSIQLFAFIISGPTQIIGPRCSNNYNPGDSTIGNRIKRDPPLISRQAQIRFYLPV